MQQLRVLAVYALILVAVVYAAIKAYVYFGIKGELDDAVAQVRPFAQISYGGISTGLEGSIGVDGIEVRSSDQPVPMRIGSLQLQGKGPGFLFDAAKGFGQDRIPPVLQINAQRLELPDMQGMVAAMLSQPDAIEGDPLTDECGLGGLLHSAGLLRSDSYPLYLDLNIGYEINVLAGAGRLEFGYDVHGGDSLSVSVKLSGMPQPGAMMMGITPAVDRLSISYRPNGEYLKMRVSDCAKKRGFSETVYVQGLLAQPAGSIFRELGFVPGDGLRQGMERFLLNPAEIQVEAGPIDKPLQLGSGTIPPEQLVKFLNLEVSVNGEPITDLGFRTTGLDDDGTAAADKEKKTKIRARYIETPRDELGKYLGRPVKVSIAGHEKLQSGVLVAVREAEVEVEKRLREGRMGMHVPFEDLERIEVLRFPDKEE